MLNTDGTRTRCPKNQLKRSSGENEGPISTISEKGCPSSSFQFNKKVLVTTYLDKWLYFPRNQMFQGFPVANLSVSLLRQKVPDVAENPSDKDQFG